MLKINLKKYGASLGVIGNILEWYNFALFMPFLHILSKEFFPLENAVHRELLSFLAMSVGLFMRPLGSAIFGPIGDRLGRSKAISISILLMAIPTVSIGLLPNYHQIGVCAPVLLIFFRALQGISLGGEYVTAMVHLVEQAPPNKRGFFGSLSDAGNQIGVLLSGQALVLLSSFFSSKEIYFFAWRIPFLFAIVLVPFAFLIPSKISNKKNIQYESIFKMLAVYRKEAICTIAITAFGAVCFYSLLTFLPYYLVSNHILSLKEATACSVQSTFIMVVFILVGGYLSDIYSKKFFIALGIVGVSFAMCFMFLGEVTSNQWQVFQLICGGFLGAYYSSRAAFFSGTFPKRVRCTVVSLSMSLAQAIFGGLTPILMGRIIRISPALVAFVVTIIAIGALTALREIKADRST